MEEEKIRRGRPKSAEPLKHISLSVPLSDLEEAKRKAEERKMTISRYFIEKALDRI